MINLVWCTFFSELVIVRGEIYKSWIWLDDLGGFCWRCRKCLDKCDLARNALANVWKELETCSDENFGVHVGVDKDDFCFGNISLIDFEWFNGFIRGDVIYSEFLNDDVRSEEDMIRDGLLLRNVKFDGIVIGNWLPDIFVISDTCWVGGLYSIVGRWRRVKTGDWWSISFFVVCWRLLFVDCSFNSVKIDVIDKDFGAISNVVGFRIDGWKRKVGLFRWNILLSILLQNHRIYLKKILLLFDVE